MITQDDFKVRLMTRNRTNKAGLIKIEVEVMKYEYAGNRKIRKFVDTSVSVMPRNWQQKTQKISSKEPDAANKQQKINVVYSSVLNFVSTKGENQTDIDGINYDNLKDFFPNIRVKRKTLVDYIDDYHKFRVKQNTKRGTTKEFVTVKNRVQKFDVWNKRKTYFESINITWSNEFESYLREKEYSNGTIEKTYTILYTVLNYYYELKDELGLELSDKFKSKKFKRGKKSCNKPNPLSWLQLLTLSKHVFEEAHLKKTQKMILFQCHTGVRFDDIKRIKPNNITKDETLKFTPVKTEHHDIEVLQPLNPWSKSLLVEVNNDTSCYDYTNQTYNRYIDDIFDIMREKYPDDEFTEYDSHNFRDTFISNAVQASVNWKSILQWVGQTSYKIMDRYIHLSPEFERSEMDKMYKIMVVQGKVVYYKE